jgi:hypothetical protein
MATQFNLPKLGRLLCVLGAIAGIGAIIQMGVNIQGRPVAECPASEVLAPTGPEAVVFAPKDQVLTVNGAVCVAVRTRAYFGTGAAKPAPLPPVAAPAAAPGQSGGSTPAPAAAAPSAAAPTAAADDTKKSEELAIFIDNHKTPATFNVPRASQEEWTWTLVKLPAPSDADDKGAGSWRSILAGPTDDGTRPIKIGIGSAKAEAPPVVAGDAVLRVYTPVRIWVIGLSLVSVLGGAIMWGWRTGMLRDRIPTETDPNPPFSLGRSQMAFWFLLTLAGYLYIWLVTNQSLNVFNQDALVLLGVSGATGLAAMTVRDDAPLRSSNGYWIDILSDRGSIVIHRLQMVAWTAVLGLLFGWSVLSGYVFPTFGTTLLVLSGIAGATYVGFKTQEAPKPTEPPADAAAGQKPRVA